MAKEELEQEAADKWRRRWQSKDSDLFEWERKKVSPFSNYIDGYIDSAEPREKKIKELKEEIQYLTMGKESLQNLGWPEAFQLFANKEKHIANLEKENAKLKEKLGDVQRQKAGEKSDLVWKLKTANEQKADQLTKAKEIIKKYMRFKPVVGGVQYYHEEYEQTEKEAEQFLSEVEK